MRFTDEQRDQAYESSSEVQKSLYEGPLSGEALYGIGKNHGLIDTDVRMSFLIAVGDVILGLVPQEKLPELLVERLEIERPAAMRITADVLDFLAPLDQPEPVKTSATAIPINSEADPDPTNDNSLASEIAEAEAAMASMQPIRTMSHDMEIKRGTPADEPTHTGASQADLLDRNATAKDKNPDARWGTEQT